MNATQIRQQTRVDRLKTVLIGEGVDLLLAAPSSDMVYLAEYQCEPSERPTLLAIAARGDAAMLLLPELESPRVADRGDLRLVTYGETDDPLAQLKSALGNSANCGRIAISDQAWAGILLRLQSAFPEASFLPASPLLRALRMRKDGGELEHLREASRRADAAFSRLIERPFAGRTEAEIADTLNHILSDAGLERAHWGPIVAGGPNSASPHHLTGERRIEEGDAVILDFGGVYGGYQADITRTVHVGPPSDEFSRVYDTVRRAQQAGFEASVAVTAAEDVDRAARAVIERDGYGAYFIHRTGHGIGLDEHEEPYIVAGNALRLEPGMTFSVEPGVYLPGRFGVRIEDTVAVTPDGPQRLNEAPHDLTVVQ